MGDHNEGAQFVNWFGPLLDALRQLGGSGSPDEVVEQIATAQGVSDDIQNELTSSGQPRFKNQVAWARFYLTKEGLLGSSKRGIWSLTERGRATSLTYEQAHGIFRRWVAVFQEQRRANTASVTVTEETLAAFHAAGRRGRVQMDHEQDRSHSWAGRTHHRVRARACPKYITANWWMSSLSSRITASEIWWTKGLHSTRPLRATCMARLALACCAKWRLARKSSSYIPSRCNYSVETATTSSLTPERLVTEISNGDHCVRCEFIQRLLWIEKAGVGHVRVPI